MVLICISLMINGVEHLLMCLLGMSSLKKCLLKFFAHFTLGYFLLSCGISLCILDVNSLAGMSSPIPLGELTLVCVLCSTEVAILR